MLQVQLGIEQTAMRLWTDPLLSDSRGHHGHLD